MNQGLFLIQVLVMISLKISNHVKGDKSEKSEPITVQEKERFKYGSRMASYMDTSVDPCEDFDRYACGNFFKVNKEESSRGVFGSFYLMIDNLDDIIHEILMEPVNISKADEAIAATKARYYYQSCMQENIFEYKKSDAYQNLIDSLGGWPLLKSNWKDDDFDWFNATSIVKSYGINTIFLENPNPIDGCSRLQVEQFGLLNMENDLERPFSRNYQINRDLTRHILIMYGLTRQNATKAFKEMIIFGRNLKSLRHKTKFGKKYEMDEMTLDELETLTPDLKWTEFYSTLYDEEDLEFLNVTVVGKSFIKRLPHLFYGKNIRRAANYFMVKLLFNLHDELKASKNMKKYCVKKIKEAMNPVLSAMFLDSKYHEKYIEDEIMAMASYIQSAFKDSIKSVNWLDRETRKSALKKLNAIEIVIGDSQLTLDMEKFNEQYSNVDVSLENGFHKNHLNLRRFAAKNEASRKPLNIIYNIDVNAFYNSIQNQLIIPAGIFRKPFYYPELPKAYNFGVIGSILGHEFTHSLDSNHKDQNEDGELTYWFSDEAEEEYDLRTTCFVNQYNSYRMKETFQKLHGTNTLPENISDNGGVRHGFYGYKKWLKANMGSLDMTRQTLPGLNMTDDQLFFLSFAQTYCEKIKGFRAHQKSIANSHTPGKWRIIGSLSNFDEFTKAFGCEKDSPMNREEKCVIW